MNLYAEPRRAGYTYRTRNIDGSFNLFDLTVEVLGESEKSYLIKVFVPVGGKPAGSQMTVRKHNVRLHEAAVNERRWAMPDYSNAWWNN